MTGNLVDPGSTLSIDKTQSGRARRARVLGLAGVTLVVGVVAAWSASVATGPAPFEDVPGCAIVTEAGHLYTGGMTKAQLAAAINKVRQLRGGGGWLLVLGEGSPQVSTTRIHYRMLDVVNGDDQTAQAIQECVMADGSL